MSRIRRYFVPALLLLPVIFICGRLLLVPLRTSKSIKLQDNAILNIGVPYAIPDTQQTGWPWVYREQVDIAGLPPFDPEFEVNYFSGWRLMADIAVAAAIVAAVAIMLVLHHRRHGVWFRFSIRELLAMIAIVAVGLSWLVSEKSHAQREQHLQQLFSYLQPRPEYCGPHWLLHFCAEDNLSTFDRVTSLQMPEADHDFGPDSADKLLAALEAFPYVGLVTIGGGPGQYIAADEPSKETLQSEHLLDSSGTTRLIRGIDAVTFNWLDDLRGKIDLAKRLPSVRHLEFDTCTITADDMTIVGQIDTLEDLRFRADSIDEASLRAIANLTRLHRLDLRGATAGDEIVDILQRLPDLHVLLLNGGDFTDNGYRRLAGLPALQRLILCQPTNISTKTLQSLRRQIVNVVVY